MTDPDELIAVDRTPEERYVLNRGLVEWGGPALCTEAMAKAMGFASVENLLEVGYRIARELESGRPLSRRDWTRALLATEIVFASDVVGSGAEWSDTTGLDDVQTRRTLRLLQLEKPVAVVLRGGAWA